MAAPSPIDPVQVAVGLKVLGAMLDDLVEHETLWPEMDEGELISWLMDWTQLMVNHVPPLEQSYHDRTLPPSDRKRYEELRKMLLGLRPVIDRLSLTPPPIIDAPVAITT